MNKCSIHISYQDFRVLSGFLLIVQPVSLPPGGIFSGILSDIRTLFKNFILNITPGEFKQFLGELYYPSLTIPQVIINGKN